MPSPQTATRRLQPAVGPAAAIASASLVWLAATTALAQPPGLSLDSDRLPNFDPAEADASEYTDAQITEWRRQHGQAFIRVVRNGPVDRKELELGAEHYANLLTNPEAEDNLPSVSEDVLTSLDVFADGDVKSVLLEAYAKALLPKLYHKKVVTRVNAVHNLGRLNEDPGSRVGNNPPRPYWPVYRALLSVVEDPARTPAEKIRAMDGLARIAADSKIPRKEKDDILRRGAAALTSMLDPANRPTKPSALRSYWFLPYKMAEMLESVESSLTLNRQPVVVEALVKAAADGSLHPAARARSLRAIASLRLDDDGDFSVAALAHLAAQLGGEMLKAYNADPKDPQWRTAWLELYLTFKPATPDEASQGHGLLAQAEKAPFRKEAAAVRAAYEAIEPVILEIAPMAATDLRPISSSATTSLQEFAAANPPSQPVHRDIGVVTVEPVGGGVEAAPEAEGGS